MFDVPGIAEGSSGEGKPLSILVNRKPLDR